MTTLNPYINSVITGEISVLADHAAQRIARLVRHKPDAVLGLATGSTPLPIYAALVRCHQDENLDFSRVICFNLDEYYPMLPSSPKSYHHYMQKNLFSKINCPNWHVPFGAAASADEIEKACRHYEQDIENAGGIDLQLLGIGRNGHIGFNEPGSDRGSRTRLVGLDRETREDARADFDTEDDVPYQAVSMGIGTILEAREIILLARGERKRNVIRLAMEGPVSDMVPASFLQEHRNVTWCLDCQMQK
jgi:glucosamine-6-phosphate deaminase